jgi:hypothetical protein
MPIYDEDDKVLLLEDINFNREDSLIRKLFMRIMKS